MTVRSLLDRKGDLVTTIEPTATLAAAAKVLGERRIGALVVTGPDHHIMGIISERDIVRAVGEQGARALETSVGETMTRKVVTCTRDDTIVAVMERMSEGKFRHVPVVEQGRLAGIISIGDVVKSRLEDMERESAALRDYIRTA
jgi:CBS domain-containing protein